MKPCGRRGFMYLSAACIPSRLVSASPALVEISKTRFASRVLSRIISDEALE